MVNALADIRTPWTRSGGPESAKLNDYRKWYVRQAIGVVGKEHLLSFKLAADSFQTLTNVRGKPCIDKRNVPVIDVATQQFDILASAGEDKVI